MLTESQIDYCLARIREQLTPKPGIEWSVNLDCIIGILKNAILDSSNASITEDSDSVYQLGLEDKTASILERAGYENVLSLRFARCMELLEVGQFGPVMLEEVRAALKRRGLRLKDDESISEIRSKYEKYQRMSKIEKSKASPKNTKQ